MTLARGRGRWRGDVEDLGGIYLGGDDLNRFHCASPRSRQIYRFGEQIITTASRICSGSICHQLSWRRFGSTGCSVPRMENSRCGLVSPKISGTIHIPVRRAAADNTFVCRLTIGVPDFFGPQSVTSRSPRRMKETQSITEDRCFLAFVSFVVRIRRARQCYANNTRTLENAQLDLLNQVAGLAREL
jgi:hypothetical protein